MSVLQDQPDRDRARQALDETIFVTAGAGAGKTRVLVDRICAMVTDAANPVPMREVAAVTFTEKAAAEMRDRVRAELSRLAHADDAAVAERARAALAELDMAAIGTLHSFAARLLMENPIEAHLPPVISLLDEVASSVRGERWWSEIRTRLLDEESTAEAMQVLLAVGVKLDAIRDVTRLMQTDWDLVEDRCGHAVGAVDLRLDLDPLRRAMAGIERRAAAECRNKGDKLYLYIPSLREWFTGVEAAVDDLERLALLDGVPKPGTAGTKRNWVDSDSMKSDVRAVIDLTAQTRRVLVRSALDVVVATLAQHVLAEADQRRRDGTLQFQDILVLARNMLRDSGAARLAAHQRYRRLLLDEFQDTDPLQIEIAVRIVAGAEGGHARWQDCPVPPGSLFVVGDAKQSIYRFRRADIATYLAAQDALAARRPAVLSTNFRSHPGVLAWVNAVFGRLTEAQPGGQPPYLALDPEPARAAYHAGRDGADGPRAGRGRAARAAGAGDARVVVLGTEPVAGLSADELREHEAKQVAAAIAQLLRDAPMVEHRVGGRWASRPLTAADVCVLVPTRTPLRELERALDDVNVPYRTEASSLVYRSDEVRDLLLTARAIDDPTDELALVEALRTPLFGCGDDDLVTWRAAGGRFRLFATCPDGVAEAHPVAESLGFLRQVARKRSLLAPSELLATIVAERRALEVATDSPQYRETWRRLRFVIDQARAWSEAEHGSLRDFLEWATRQAAQEEKANEIVLPEKDVDAIRILTVHAAKGLEFPVVVLTGMTTTPKTDPGRLVWPAEGPPEVSAGGDARTAGWAGAYDQEKSMLHLEVLRLLYVAATRAESRLVVSLVRNDRSKGLPEDRRSWTRAELLASASSGARHEAWSLDPSEVRPLPAVGPQVGAPMAWDDWVAIRDRARAAALVREADSATDIAHGLVPVPEGLELPAGLLKEPRDLELPAWLKGRYGAAVGRAVHATLQTVDLVTGAGLDGVAEAQAMAESVTDRLESVRALARAGWESASVRAAAAREHHKETYVGTVIGRQLVEGYIDLLYRDDDGALVVIDYKTDADPSPETVQAYQAQLAVYARALADATGERVSRGVLVFCREGGAVEREVPATGGVL